MHYERNRKGRAIGSAAPQKRMAGEGSVTQGGYIVTTLNGRSRLEHRRIMEQLLGRPLEPHETVHHVNGQRSDNRTNGPLQDFRSGNLELWSRSQPSGQRAADKLAWAREIIALYEPIADKLA
jgi:hypothetical protein